MWLVCKVFKGSFICVGGFNWKEGNDVIRIGWVDVVVFGWYFFVNLDLFKCFVFCVFFNKYDCSIFYM